MTLNECEEFMTSLMRLSVKYAFLLTFFLSLSASYAQAANVRIQINGPKHLPVEFTVEQAFTEEQRAKGLMHRHQLGANEGMLFYFPNKDRHQIWMKDTFIPLDIIYLSPKFEIQQIFANAQPESLMVFTPAKRARYVLEINGGMAAKHKLAVGDTVKFLP